LVTCLLVRIWFVGFAARHNSPDGDKHSNRLTKRPTWRARGRCLPANMMCCMASLISFCRMEPLLPGPFHDEDDRWGLATRAESTSRLADSADPTAAKIPPSLSVTGCISPPKSLARVEGRSVSA
jgi:hypothetical protein